jgi:hypothetical protein
MVSVRGTGAHFEQVERQGYETWGLLCTITSPVPLFYWVHESRCRIVGSFLVSGSIQTSMFYPRLKEQVCLTRTKVTMKEVHNTYQHSEVKDHKVISYSNLVMRSKKTCVTCPRAMVNHEVK